MSDLFGAEHLPLVFFSKRNRNLTTTLKTMKTNKEKQPFQKEWQDFKTQISALLLT